MRAVWVVLLAAPLVARAADGDLARAASLERAVAQAHGAARMQVLETAAAMPWPTVPPDVENEIATHFQALSPNARRAWALDRALPILAGELAVTDDLLAKVLAELRSAASRPDARTSEFAEVQEARNKYARGDLKAAEARYGEVTQGSPLWTEALRERAWALLIDRRPSEALGATVSLQAPYFPTEDHAEGRLLKATVLLSKCRFAEARDLVAPFADAQVPALTEDAARAAIEQGKAPAGDVGAKAFAAPLVQRVVAAVSEHPADAKANAWRAELVRTGTRLLLDAYASETEAVRELAERALDVRYEALRGERRLLEAGKKLGTPRPDKLSPLDDDEVAWTFDGTFWRDELGNYRYAAGSACPPETRK